MEQLQSQTSNGAHSQILSDVTLSTSQQRKEQLENLLYQKVQKGEDISPYIQALDYFSSKSTTQDQLQKMWTEVAKERSVFTALQRIIITAFAILGMIAFFNGAFKFAKPSKAVINPPITADHH